jgi:hypothetical protein
MLTQRVRVCPYRFCIIFPFIFSDMHESSLAMANLLERLVPKAKADFTGGFFYIHFRKRRAVSPPHIHSIRVSHFGLSKYSNLMRAVADHWCTPGLPGHGICILTCQIEIDL